MFFQVHISEVRALSSLAMVLLLLLTVLSTSIGASEPDDHEGPLVSRVCASFPGEFISLANDGPPADIRGWRLSDGEGSVIFNASLIIPKGGVLTWVAPGSFFPELYPEEAFIGSDDPRAVLKGGLKLADAGDQVFLFDRDGTLRDVVCYGNAEPPFPWSGPPAVLKKGSALIRSGPGTGPGNWQMTVPGIFSISTPPIPAEVVPLLNPVDAFPELIRQVDLSRSSIELACYLMENWTLARHLAGAAARGVDVTILLEGRPVGGVSENGAAIAYHLQDSGAEVWTMRSGESFRRYDYLHAKYVIFDRERLFVSSENMADSSFGSNRGWSVIVASQQICSYAGEVFEKDLAAKGVDIFPLNTSLARADGGPGVLLEGITAPPVLYSATAALLTSPDQVRGGLVEMLSGAQRRIVVQQMRIDEEWLEGSEVISALYSAADRGVAVRIQLDSGLGTEEGNKEVVKRLGRMATENRWDLECRLTHDRSSFGRLHNKGVIVDDAVMVGSANWVDGSMERNREMAVILRSSPLSETFARWFSEDWKGDADPPIISLAWHYLEAREGEPIMLDATGCNDPSGVASITWDLDRDGVADLRGPAHVITLKKGEHTIQLRAEDSLGNVAMDNVTVVVKAGPAPIVPYLIYIPLPVALVIVLLRRSRRL